jgi:aspartate carbamoyltransferase catalytic subunit
MASKNLRHLLSVDQLDTELIERMFTYADAAAKNFDDKNRFHRPGGPLQGHILHRLFYKESTRTYESFGFAAEHLGMGVQGSQSVQFSSVAKGETLEDTIRVISAYLPSLIVLRSAKAGDAARAAEFASVPIVNGGDGSGEHPTQGLYDLYTAREELGRTSNLKVVMGGDLSNGRTARSFTKLLAKYPGNSFTFISPPTFEMGDDIKQMLDEKGLKYTETSELETAFKEADIVYWTRVQTERLTDEQAKFLKANPGADKKYVIGAKEIALMRKDARLMHPLPRVGEIDPAIDNDPRAIYFDQVHYGLRVRMAIIEWVLGYIE